MIKNLNILFVFLISLPVFAQTKIEYEKRIAQEKFPRKAIELLQPKLENVRRLRFYEEFDGKKSSFESKFKFEGKHYSVEFNKEGVLEDVEVKLSDDEISEEVLSSIENYLENNFERWKIEKMQWQFNVIESPEKLLEDAFKLQERNSNNYELIVATKTNGKLEKFEILFDHKGSFLKKRKVVRRSYDFLLF